METPLTLCSKITKEMTRKQQSRCWWFLKCHRFVDRTRCPLLHDTVSDPCSIVVISCSDMTPSWRCSELVPEQMSQWAPSPCVTPRDFPQPEHCTPHPLSVHPAVRVASATTHSNEATHWRGARISVQTVHVSQVWIWPNSLWKCSLHSSQSACTLLLVALAENCLYITGKLFPLSKANTSSSSSWFLHRLWWRCNTEPWTGICHSEEGKPLPPERFKSSRHM